MKMFIFFMILNISCLSIQPALDLIIKGEVPSYCVTSCHSTTQKECDSVHSCSDHDHDNLNEVVHKHEHEDQGGCSHVCNPFLTCGCCTLLNINLDMFAMVLVSEFYYIPTGYTQDISISHLPSFWHPPQIV